jgi:hypothetical protein
LAETLPGAKLVSATSFVLIVTKKEPTKEKWKSNMIIDNDFAPKNLVDEIASDILGWKPNFQWVFAPASNREDQNGHSVLDPNVFEYPMFVSPVGPGHPYRARILALFDAFVKKHSLKYREIIRIKINIVPMAGPESVGKYQMPHVDSDQPHKVFLYYVNDADGDTYFFKERFAGEPVTSFTIDQTVTPEAGKAAWFDGDTFHAPSAPTRSPYRCVINIDFS